MLTTIIWPALAITSATLDLTGHLALHVSNGGFLGAAQIHGAINRRAEFVALEGLIDCGLVLWRHKAPVREAHELASGKIPDALHIPLGTLLRNEDTVGDIASDAPVVVYCQHGMRSFSAASHLLALGFTNVAHIAGGIVRWKGDLA